MQTASDIIDTLGGASALARALDVPVSTATAWKHRGSIPARYWADVVRFSEEVGTPVAFETLASAAAQSKEGTAA